MIKRVAFGSILCLVLIVPVAAVQAHGGKAHTKVTLDAFEDNPMPGTQNGFFSGSVGSPRTSCKTDRELRVFFQKNGKDKAVGQGSAFEEHPGKPTPFDIVGRTEKSGKYYVKAAATKNCKASSSKTIRVTIVN